MRFDNTTRITQHDLFTPDEDMGDMLDEATTKRGKQYNPLESQKPSSTVSLETWYLTKTLISQEPKHNIIITLELGGWQQIFGNT